MVPGDCSLKNTISRRDSPLWLVPIPPFLLLPQRKHMIQDEQDCFIDKAL